MAQPQAASTFLDPTLRKPLDPLGVPLCGQSVSAQTVIAEVRATLPAALHHHDKGRDIWEQECL